VIATYLVGNGDASAGLLAADVFLLAAAAGIAVMSPRSVSPTSIQR
jgi:hypothetical protein